jgi:excisionase family DNA binding protein
LIADVYGDILVAEVEQRRTFFCWRTNMTTSEHGLQARALSVDEACDYIGISRVTLYELMGNGRLPHVKLGRRTLLLKEHLDSLLDASVVPVR